MTGNSVSVSENPDQTSRTASITCTQADSSKIVTIDISQEASV